MRDDRYALPVLASVTGLAWMAAVLLISANHKGIDAAGDRAYDWANRAHTVALLLLLVTVLAIQRTLRARQLAGGRAATALVAGAVLMLVGNVVAFWGALLTDGTAEEFWGGVAGWVIFLPGSLLVLGGFIALAVAARSWSGTTTARRWQMASVGVFLSITTITWAGEPLVTLVPALLATFALLATGTTVAQAEPRVLPDSSTPAAPRMPTA